MPQYTLHYLNLRARGQLARLLFVAAGVEFTDHRIPFEVPPFKEWQEEKKNTERYPFGVCPTLEVDGKILPESIALARYLADELGLNGKDNWDKAWCEIFVETFQELKRECCNPFSPFAPKDKDEAAREQKKKELFEACCNPSSPKDSEEAAREQKKKELFEGVFAKKMKILEGFLKSNNEGKDYLVGDKLTWADLTFIDSAEWFTEIYPSCLDATPLLKELNKRVRDLPKIKAFLDARPPSIL